MTRSINPSINQKLKLATLRFDLKFWSLKLQKLFINKVAIEVAIIQRIVKQLYPVISGFIDNGNPEVPLRLKISSQLVTMSN